VIPIFSFRLFMMLIYKRNHTIELFIFGGP
jgi:hypothetical protein